MSGSYSDSRFGVNKMVKIGDNYAMTSVQASAATVRRITVMENCTVTDWNCCIIDGATCTGSTSFAVTLNKSLGGTGTVAAIGTATLAGTSADLSVVDGSVVGGTGCDLVTGDDIVINTVAGTALPAGDVHADFYVTLREKFV